MLKYPYVEVYDCNSYFPRPKEEEGPKGSTPLGHTPSVETLVQLRIALNQGQGHPMTCSRFALPFAYVQIQDMTHHGTHP